MLLSKTHAQIKRIHSENPRRHLYSTDYEKKAAMGKFMCQNHKSPVCLNVFEHKAFTQETNSKKVLPTLK